MIIQFSFSNYKTFKDKTVLNLVASNYDKASNEKSNIFRCEKLNLRALKSSVIFGANASGKSKFIEALTFFIDFIQDSSKESLNDASIPTIPFRLNDHTRDRSSEFELIFISKNVIYRYGFEVTQKEIVAEWLYSRDKTREVELFYRSEQNFDFNQKRLKKAGTLIKEDLIRKNALLLSVLAQFNDELASSLILYLKSISSISGLNEHAYKNNSIEKVIANSTKKEQILELIKGADFGIDDLRYEDIVLSLPEWKESQVKQFKDTISQLDPYALSTIRTKHKIYNDTHEVTGNIEFSMQQDESSGTQKFFYLTGLILDALENGTILFIDELDSKLHPNLVCKIVSLFNSTETNPRNAQLIFNTHDTNLLNSGLFRRDQIWFVAKNEYGAARLYSLADFKTSVVRKNESYEDNYIKGKYGAIPFLGDFEDITRQILSQDGKAK